jgi:thioredoxin reductase (NADPH)
MYDSIIIGLGAAGYTAAIYCARYKLKTLIVGSEEGGTGMSAAEVGDWPGTEFIKGPDLMENMKNHALSFEDVEHKISRVETVEKNGDVFRVSFQSGETVEGKTIVFCTGGKHRKLGVQGEKEFAGKGVSYCATCDAFFFKDKNIAVVGGGDAAVEGAAIAAQVAKHLYLIHRRNEFRAEPFWVKERDNVTFVLERNVTDILGDTVVTGVRLDTPFEDKDTIDVSAVFVEIGADPDSALAKDLGCTLDKKDHIQVDAGMATTIEGAYAAGDVSTGSNYFAQFTTAASEGSIAANSLFNYLGGKAGGKTT